ncbi:MAG: hypothetical protein ACM31C_20500 [Acidobacteriota bacterium]
MRGSLAVCAALAACTSGPSIDGNATISVIDLRGQPAAGVELVSTAGGSVLARAVTDDTGTAALGVADGGEVTAYVAATGGSYESDTLFGVAPGLALELPLHVDASGQSLAPLAVVLALDPRASFGGASDLRAYVGVDTSCAANATAGAPTSVPLAAGCLQTDATITITGLLYDSNGSAVGYAVASDQPPGSAPRLTIEPTANTPLTLASADVELPALPSADTRASTLLAFSRKGHAFGIPAIRTDASPIANLRVQGTLVEGALADSLLAAFELTSLARGVEIGEEAWAPGATTTHLAGSLAPQAPDDLAIGARGGRPTVAITDPAVAGALDTYVSLSWTGGDGVAHAWHAWAAAPTAAGTRTFEVPPAPAGASFATWAPPSSAALIATGGYNQADFAPADYRLAPEPYIPVARDSGERSYALMTRR